MLEFYSNYYSYFNLGNDYDYYNYHLLFLKNYSYNNLYFHLDKYYFDNMKLDIMMALFQIFLDFLNFVFLELNFDIIKFLILIL